MLHKLAEKEKSKWDKYNDDDDKTKQVEVDDNVEVVETDNGELDDEKYNNIDRTRPYLDW